MTDETIRPEKFHGMHSLPKEFWNIDGSEKDAAKARRKIKRVNHERNQQLHREWNQFEGGSGSKPASPRPIGGKKYFNKHGKRRGASPRRTH